MPWHSRFHFLVRLLRGLGRFVTIIIMESIIIIIIIIRISRLSLRAIALEIQRVGGGTSHGRFGGEAREGGTSLN